MSDLIGGILVVLLVGIAAGLILWFSSQKKREKEEKVIAMAAENGWHYEKIQSAQRSGFILKQGDWTFESISTSSSSASDSGSSSISHLTRWLTVKVTSSSGLVLVGPKLPSIQLGNLGSFVLQKALSLMLGDEAAEAVGLAEVEAGRLSFRERYSVWATSLESAQAALTYEVENSLLNWKLKEVPIIKISSHGVEIKLKEGRIDKPDEIKAVIDLGSSFLRE